MTAMTQWVLIAFTAIATGALAVQVDPANLPPPALSRLDFVRDVQPIPARHCYSCHGPDQQKNDLR